MATENQHSTSYTQYGIDLIAIPAGLLAPLTVAYIHWGVISSGFVIIAALLVLPAALLSGTSLSSHADLIATHAKVFEAGGIEAAVALIAVTPLSWYGGHRLRQITQTLKQAHTDTSHR